VRRLEEANHSIRTCDAGIFCDSPAIMSATEATAEIFVRAFKALKPREREAVFERIVADAALAEDLADTLSLEKRRRQPRERFRDVMKELKIRV
jgi:hypothetical protein